MDKSLASKPAWPPGDSAMAKRVREHEWSATPLGPTDTWSAELRTAAALVLDSGFPAALIWGPGLVTIYNDGFRPILGDKPEALGRSFADIWSEAWHEIGPIAQRAYAGQPTFIEDYPLVINRIGAPEQAYFTFSYSPVRATDGTVLGMIDTVVETTASVISRERMKLLTAELQRRVRNVLATIRSIVQRSAESSDSVEDYAMHLDGRINAVARVQSIVTRDPAGGVDLATLVAEELLVARAREGEEVEMAGPEVRLAPKAAETFGLILNELVTNAVKFGALGVSNARIAVNWTVDSAESGRTLTFVWKERGSPSLDHPGHSGFGTELLDRTLPYELGGSAERIFETDGVRCTIVLPMSDRVIAGS